ncbi:MAG: hypothetical protein ACRD34_00055 [Bryobacteraceae bacterium]
MMLVECADHAKNQEEIQRSYIEACGVRDRLKIELDEVVAGASEEFRATKDENGKAFTGERIAYLIHADAKVISQKTKLLAATREAALWQAVSDAMQARRRMLSELVTLMIQGGAPGNNLPAATTAGSYALARRRMADAREEKA